MRDKDKLRFCKQGNCASNCDNSDQSALTKLLYQRCFYLTNKNSLIGVGR